MTGAGSWRRLLQYVSAADLHTINSVWRRLQYLLSAGGRLCWTAAPLRDGSNKKHPERGGRAPTAPPPCDRPCVYTEWLRFRFFWTNLMFQNSFHMFPYRTSSCSHIKIFPLSNFYLQTVQILHLVPKTWIFCSVRGRCIAAKDHWRPLQSISLAWFPSLCSIYLCLQTRR